MKHALLIIITGVSLQLNAQTFEFAPIGASWWYNSNEISAVGYMQIESVGDTVILSKLCRILKKTKHYIDLSSPDHDEHTYEAGYEYIFQDDSLIYYYSDGTFWTLYDFTASVGDTWQVYYNDPDVISLSECDSLGTIEVTERSDTIIDGFNLIKMQTQHYPGSLWSFYEHDILERIGSLFYLFPGVTNDCISSTDNYVPGPLRCYQDAEIGMVKFSEEECDYIYLGVSEISDNLFNIWPNPADGIIYVRGNYTEDVQLEFSDITGKNIPVNALRSSADILSANISFLPAGIYFINIYDENIYIGTQKILKL